MSDTNKKLGEQKFQDSCAKVLSFFIWTSIGVIGILILMVRMNILDKMAYGYVFIPAYFLLLVACFMFWILFKAGSIGR